jgi:hypothetical protein
MNFTNTFDLPEFSGTITTSLLVHCAPRLVNGSTTFPYSEFHNRTPRRTGSTTTLEARTDALLQALPKMTAEMQSATPYLSQATPNRTL